MADLSKLFDGLSTPRTTTEISALAKTEWDAESKTNLFYRFLEEESEQLRKERRDAERLYNLQLTKLRELEMLLKTLPERIEQQKNAVEAAKINAYAYHTAAPQVIENEIRQRALDRLADFYRQPRHLLSTTPK